MAAAAATATAAAVSSSRLPPLIQPTSNATFVSFPRLPLPATTLALSTPSQLSLVPAANPKYHNAKVDAGDEDVEGEELLRRFNWQVSRAGVMEEIRRRRRHEDARDKRKRKARYAGTTTTMAAAAATATTAAVSSSRLPPLIQPTSNATFVSFPRLPLPATTLALSTPSQLSLVPAANPKYHNAKVDAGDEDVEGEELLRRFNWQVSRAGVMEEIRRRRRHEDARDKRKRKARYAARRFRRRRFKGPYPFSDDQGVKEQTTDDEDNDNWELPAGELPSYS